MLVSLNERQTFYSNIMHRSTLFYIQKKNLFLILIELQMLNSLLEKYTDQNGKNLNMIALGAPFRKDKHKQLFYKYKKMGFQ